jgi:hypothetical protein
MSKTECVLTYNDLEVRYGVPMAYDILLTIEKLAKIQDELAKAEADNDQRLQRALGRLDGIDFSAMP